MYKSHEQLAVQKRLILPLRPVELLPGSGCPGTALCWANVTNSDKWLVGTTSKPSPKNIPVTPSSFLFLLPVDWL